ncbi:MAG: AbrB/MazE/SpoVT family DNA-binding domain-containing protein [Candidatus Bipolaricaulota bacterium]|nr:AbrB/MazE/SpoVT family DNA-binding domain-containing protein [Candidatus Bipolaricaulota bacterium]MDW8030713.1 AbrB/MazE/SpoVT family DNA-binding domain-containing protein [Candidatus Bipolaricaulota bacterium]
MPLVKLSARCQVTIPKEIIEQLGLKSGDPVEVTHKDRSIVITPLEDAWFWSKEWQEKEREADEALAHGDYKDFDDVAELIRDLRS